MPRAAVLQIVDAGQARGGRQWQRGTDRGAERLVARLGYAVPHQVLSVFEQHARRLAAFVALDAPARRIGRISPDADGPERRRAQPQRVPIVTG